MTGEERLKTAAKRLRPQPNPLPPPLNPNPTNPFELAIAAQIAEIQRDIDELKTRLNWLLTLIVGAALANVILSLFK